MEGNRGSGTLLTMVAYSGNPDNRYHLDDLACAAVSHTRDKPVWRRLSLILGNGIRLLPHSRTIDVLQRFGSPLHYCACAVQRILRPRMGVSDQGSPATRTLDLILLLFGVLAWSIWFYIEKDR